MDKHKMKKFVCTLVIFCLFISFSVLPAFAADFNGDVRTGSLPPVDLSDAEVNSVGADAAVKALQYTKDMVGKTVILHSNDVHGAISGYAYIAAMQTEFTERGADVILADAGDFSQGSTYVSVSKGLDAVELMNLTGYDVAVPGNHEFDYGYSQLAENMKSADFDILCSNALDEDGNLLFDNNEIIKTASGLKVGFFGLATPETLTKANPALTQGLTFLTNSSAEKIWDNAQQQIDTLKTDGADIVICLSHLGVDPSSAPHSAYDLWSNTDGIDFVIDGHSHTVMTKGSGGEPIQSTGTGFQNVGIIIIDNAEKKIESNSLRAIDDDSAADEIVAAAAKAVIDAVDAAYNTVFAYSEVELNGEKQAGGSFPNGNRDGETNSGDFVTDALRWCLTEKYPGSITDVDEDHIVALFNGGGIRAAIHKGDVTKKDIFNVLPFSNTLSVVYVSGAELLEALEASTFSLPLGGFPQVSGISYTICTDKPYDAEREPYPGSTYYGPASINRISINNINSKPFSLTDEYAILTNDFCAGGGDTYYAFAAAEKNFDTGYTVDTVVMDYITEKLGGIIGNDYAEPQGRVSIEKKVERISGKTRIETAVSVSQTGWENGAENVVLASAVNYADALCASPLAYALDAPVLLTAADSVPEQSVADELARLDAKNVYIVGGSAAVSANIEKALSDNFSVTRLSGATRYETSVRIAEELAKVSGDPESILFASGENFPDALSAGPAAALTGSPILFVSSKGALDDTTAGFAAKQNCDAYVLGGTAAVSDTGYYSIDDVCGTVKRIYGKDRFETAEKAAQCFAYCYSGKCIVTATGKSFPDALAGIVFAAKNGAPLLFCGDSVSESLGSRAAASEKIYIIGGSGAVSLYTEKALAAA